MQGSQIKCRSPFQDGNNKINRNVKSFFLSVKFVSSQVIIISWLSCSFRTSYMSRWGVVLAYISDLLDLGLCHSPLVLGLIRDKGRMLRGQVNLCI